MLQHKTRKVRLIIAILLLNNRLLYPKANVILTRRATFAIAGGSNATHKSPDALIVYCMTQSVLLGLQVAKRGPGIRIRAKTLKFCDCK